MKSLNYKIILTVFSIFFLTALAKAQNVNFCGTVDAQKKLLEERPELKQQINLLNEQLNKIDAAHLQKNRSGNYIIPVVVHILHDYGSENISDDQVKDAIRILNEDFQKMNADTASVISVFQPIVANVGIEFKLATKDPLGHCTDGIDRINTYLTNKAGDNSKINQWAPNHYLNIWVAKTVGLSGFAAYTPMPAAAHFAPQTDGVMILNDYFGSIGTSTLNYSRGLTHNLGHYLNLLHPGNEILDPNTGCGDDFVLDTPPTKENGLCNLSYSFCNPPIIENVQNFMTYSYCTNMFTNGQKDRMLDCLNDLIAHRSDLIKTSNLIATGTENGTPALNCDPVADFNSLLRFRCLGNYFSLTNFSYRKPIASSEWTLPNAIPATSNSKNVIVAYNSSGWQSVTLKVTDSSNLSSTTTKSDYIYVSDPADQNSINVANEFENPTDYPRWPIFNYFNNQFKWKYYDGGHTPTGWRALMFDGFDNRPSPENELAGPFQDIDDIITPSYNTSSLSGGYLSFKYAAATTAGNINQTDDSLIIYVSKDCGTTWTVLSKYFTNKLINNGSLQSAFYPDANTTWNTASIALLPLSISSTVYFKIRHRGGTFSNNLFIDDFMVGNYPTSLSSVSKDVLNFSLVPNPTTENADVVFSKNATEDFIITVTDIVGKTIFTENVKANSVQNKAYHLPSSVFKSKGIYMVTLNENGNKQSQKLVVQ